MKLDIFFLSYQESNADKNWQQLTKFFPQAQRVHGITGIKNAHQIIAKKAQSDFFFVVDGDNHIADAFDFTAPKESYAQTLYVWRAKNPINDLCYGFGGIKLYNKWLLLENTKKTSVDIATSIAIKYVPVPVIASTTCFNVSALESWRAGFRESAKLTLNLLKNPNDTASRSRLDSWQTKGADRPFGKECINGAILGHNFAKNHFDDALALNNLNDFEWLNQFAADQKITLPP